MVFVNKLRATRLPDYGEVKQLTRNETNNILNLKHNFIRRNSCIVQQLKQLLPQL